MWSAPSDSLCHSHLPPCRRRTCTPQNQLKEVEAKHEEALEAAAKDLAAAVAAEKEAGQKDREALTAAHEERVKAEQEKSRDALTKLMELQVSHGCGMCYCLRNRASWAVACGTHH